MRKCLFYLLLALWIFGGVANGHSQEKQMSGDGVLTAVADYDRAWNAKDVNTVAKMLADDYVYFSSTGGVSDRKSTLEFLKDPKYKLTFVERSEMKVYRNDGRMAVVGSRWKGKGSWSGGEINDDQRCGQVFIKEKDQWKLVSEHCVQIAKTQ